MNARHTASSRADTGRVRMSPALLFGIVVAYAVVSFLGWVLSGTAP